MVALFFLRDFHVPSLELSRFTFPVSKVGRSGRLICGGAVVCGCGVVVCGCGVGGVVMV